jgi:K(+)-stimulated pyrophosphate-energized sodium pump
MYANMITLVFGIISLVAVILFNKNYFFSCFAFFSAVLLLCIGGFVQKIKGLSPYWLLIPVAIALISGVGSLLFLLKKKSNKKANEVSSAIKGACNKFLLIQYLIIGGIILFISSLLMVFKGVAPGIFCFLGGSVVMLSGLIAMQISSSSSGRILEAVVSGNSKDGLKVGILSGISTVLITHSLAIIAGFVCFFMQRKFLVPRGVNPRVFFYGVLGSSLAGLLSRTCGGIFTKAADVSGDLVGKVQSDLPEDDIRNPACIADNTGDHVGDVMSSVSGITSSLFILYRFASVYSFIKLPQAVVLLFGGLLAGGLASLGSYLFPKVSSFASTNRQLTTINLLFLLGGAHLSGVFNKFSLGFMVLGVILGDFAYVMSSHYTDRNKPVMGLVKASEFGGGTNVISGLALAWSAAEKYAILFFAGSIVVLPAVLYFNARQLSPLHFSVMFGVAMRAFSVQVCDLIGAPVDNAGGLAEMAKLPKKVREETDKLDSIGNSTKAGTKVFDVFLSFSSGIGLFLWYFDFKEYTIEVMKRQFYLFSIPGILLGIALVFGFKSRTMGSVSALAQDAAARIIRQFKEKPGILTNKEKPNHQEIIGFITNRAMLHTIPAILVALVTIALVFPIYLGSFMVFFPWRMSLKSPILPMILLTGGLTAFILSMINGLYLCIGGGAFDNAKKTIEATGEKNSPEHKAAVIGDTLGDPMKDTTGPSLITFGVFALIVTILLSGLIS